MMMSKDKNLSLWISSAVAMLAWSWTITGTTHADLVGLWRLDGDTSDSSTSGIEGTLEGDIAFTNDVPALLGSGMSVELNMGAGPSLDPGYVDLGNPDILNFSDNDWTISAWMKTPAGNTTRGNIYSNGGDNAGGVRYVLAFIENGGQAIVLTTDDNSTKRQAQANAVDWVVDDEEWHHVVGLREDTELRVYIDGEFAADNLDLPPGYDLSGTEQQNAVIGIGISEVDGSFEKAFIGWIDDVAVFDEALSEDQILTVMGGDFSAWGVGGAARLQAGDANMDLNFNQLDLVQVQVAAKYLTGQQATWGEGDWDGAPGGEPGAPPAGDGQFNQLDIIAALNAGKYLTGPYGALSGPGGAADDDQTSIVYNPSTGELAVDAPAGTELTSINIDSAGAIFTGDAAANLGGSFDNDADNNIFKATFGSSFGSLSFGNVAQTGLSQEFVLNDLTVIGSLAGGGDLGAVDLIYVPEPSTALLAVLGMTLLLTLTRRCPWQTEG